MPIFPKPSSQQRSKKGHRIEPYPKTDSGIRDIDLAPELSTLLKELRRELHESLSI